MTMDVLQKERCFEAPGLFEIMRRGLRAKAGLTGLAQIYGKYNTTPYDKLKLDLTYIQNYSIWMDLKLMLLTIKILFWPDSTEGVEAEQVTALKTQQAERNKK